MFKYLFKFDTYLKNYLVIYYYVREKCMLRFGLCVVSGWMESIIGKFTIKVFL